MLIYQFELALPEHSLSRYAFDFALSFAGENRSKAKRLAKLLTAKGAMIFYDDKFKSDLHGKSLTDEFERIYGATSRYVVVFVSADYAKKEYTNYEFSIAKKEAKNRKSEYILPLRLDDTVLLGLPQAVAYIDLRKDSLAKTAAYLMEKLAKTRRGKIKRIKSRIVRLVATFGVVLSELRVEKTDDGMPLSYSDKCDWLVEDLGDMLRQTGIDYEFLGDERDGEGLSARIAFDWDTRSKWFGFGRLHPWELLELRPYSEIYPDD